MCGIIGYTGKASAVPILLKGLAALEYRGYDSAGIAVCDEKFACIKCKGKIENLEKRIKNEKEISGNCGIGHTRWATHGEPSEKNAHPHLSDALALVHNGIIENYAQIQAFLLQEGYLFKSETDTEAAAHLIDFYYKKLGDKHSAITAAINDIRGSYAFCIIFKNDMQTIWAVRSGSPLLCAKANNGVYFASDVTAILPYTKDYYKIEEKIIACADYSGVKFFNQNGEEVASEKINIDWSVESAQKGGYSHYMLKEINEQPQAIKNTVANNLRDGLPFFSCDTLDRYASSISSIKIIACGTAMHAGLLGKNIIERFARMPVSVEIASEFRYSEPILDKNTLVIAISQSGETADTIAAMRLAREKGAKTLSIVNVVGSTLARTADNTIYTRAGPEISVASTKAYTVQCAVLYLIAFKLALCRGKISVSLCKSLCNTLQNELCDAIDEVLQLQDKIKRMAERLSLCGDMFFIGRGVDSYICMEGSLKLKEISYIHSEAYPAGELKHGTISLIDSNVPIVALITAENTAEKTVSNIREAKARGAKIFSFCTESQKEALAGVSDYNIALPVTEEVFAPIVAAVAFQLLAYYTAVEKGNDVDKPRNLAKSVTVE